MLLGNQDMFKKNITFILIFLVGIYTFNGYGANESNDYYEESCKNGNIKSCYDLGVSYENGIGVQQDYDKAYFFYQKSCNYKIVNACYNLGVLHYHGYGRNKDTIKAKSFFLKSCKLGSSDGCNHYSRLENKKIKIAKEKYKEEMFIKKKKRFYAHQERKIVYLDGNQSREIYNQDMNKEITERKFIKMDKDGKYYEIVYKKGY